MGSSEKFCLRWNDFESNISLAFREIRDEKDFFDCTLSCGSRQIQAHKLILSACSPFFRSILRQNPHQHPLLYMKGVAFTDMQAVLNFMYHGEVNVAQDELNSFLAVAEDLKVKGLTQNNSSDSNSSSKPKSEASSNVPRPRPPRQDEPSFSKRAQTVTSNQPSAQRIHEDDEIQEVVPIVKQEPLPANPEPISQPLVTRSSEDMYQSSLSTPYQDNTVAQLEESYGDDEYDYGGYGEEEYGGAAGTDQNKGLFNVSSSRVEECIRFQDGSYVCTICGKEFPQHKANCKRHIILVHTDQADETRCPVCNKTYKTEQSMKSHMRQSHGIYRHKN